MTKAIRARYTLEFKREAVGLVEGGQSQATVAKTLAKRYQEQFGGNRAYRLNCP